MKHLYLYIFILSALVLCNKSTAQETKHFNIDIYNDLPSNNVYNLTIDHLGYLWIATDKGVGKYNGYNLTTFDLNRDFINKDVWNLFEDKSGKMWLFSISDNLTYVYNNEPHNIKTKSPMGTFYPRHMYNYKDGVALITTFTNNQNLYFCYIRNDSLIYTRQFSNGQEFAYIDSSSKLITLAYDGHRTVFDMVDTKYKSFKTGRLNYDKDTLHRMLQNMREERLLIIGHCLFSYTHNSNYIRIVNLDSLNYRKIIVDNDTAKIKILFTPAGDIVNAVTENKVVTLNKWLYTTNEENISVGYDNISGSNITYIVNDKFWQRVVATNITGVHAIPADDTFFKKENNLPNEAIYIGKASDSVTFWCNNSTGTLYKVVNGVVAIKRNVNVAEISKVIRLDDQYSLLFNYLHSYRLNNKTLELTDKSVVNGAKDAIIYAPNQLLYISNINGVTHGWIEHGEVKYSVIERSRYKELLYDSIRKLFIAYNDRKIVLLRDNKIITTITRADLEARSLNNITRIMTDNKYGNIILHEGERIITFTNPLGSYKTLFGNVVLNDAKLCLAGDIFIVSDAFGIMFSKILGPGQFSKPVLYPNLKGLKYKFVYDLKVINGKAVIKTDRGYLEIALPPEHAYAQQQRNSFFDYKLVITNNRMSYSIKGNDTIKVGKRSRRLQFDIIKPSGFGKIKYRFKINNESSEWGDVSNDELILTRLTAGRYYSISIIAYDKQWRSNVHTFTIYYIPDWWEKPFFQRILWIGGTLLLIALIYIIVIITKRIVTRNTTLKNQKLEQELKSIYSQINPHFIFNSLTAAMYLIKTGKLDEAYDHIYKFSHLLRSYIKSSRNKLITVSDEIKNLTNYIELQQARFKNKFDYEIVVSDAVDTNTNIPSLLLQPIVENAITHGLLHKGTKGKLLIEFEMREHDDVLICNIDDDGVGRQQSKNMTTGYIIKEESYGNELIKNLIDTFNKYEKMKIEIEYLDKQLPLTGTIAQLRFKAIK